MSINPQLPNTKLPWKSEHSHLSLLHSLHLIKGYFFSNKNQTLYLWSVFHTLHNLILAISLYRPHIFLYLPTHCFVPLVILNKLSAFTVSPCSFLTLKKMFHSLLKTKQNKKHFNLVLSSHFNKTVHQDYQQLPT